MPLISSNVKVEAELNQDKEYKNYSFLPKVSPECPQLLIELPKVFLDHKGELENVFALNLNKRWPRHDGGKNGL